MLVVFDVDGTLTQTESPTQQALAEAFIRTFDARLPCDDWSTYRRVTAPGILREAVQATFARLPTEEEEQTFQQIYTEFIAYWLFTQKDRVEVTGAVAAVERLRAAGHTVAVATGDFRESAELKLERAGFDLEDTILASGDDDDRREGILSHAILQSGGQDAFDHVVYVGDGLWDLKATRELNLPMVGIDYGHTGRLEAAGAALVIPDYEDYSLFVRCLERTRAV